MTSKQLRNPVGGHVPVAGGLHSVGLSYARDLLAETVQVFVANPRGWATPVGNPRQDEAFRAACADASIPAYVHAPYLINFGSHTEATVERSVESLRHSLRRGREIGALGVVVHTGSATGGRERSVALGQVRSSCCRCSTNSPTTAIRICSWSRPRGRAPPSAHAPGTSGRTSRRSTRIRSWASASTPATSSRPGTI